MRPQISQPDMEQTDKKRLFGLIGYPLEHSFSYRWFADTFSREGIADSEYRNFPLPAIDMLPELMRTPELAGFNVTAPYKKEVIRYIDTLDETAATIGAVNCVTRNNGKWTGHNVDCIGFAASLREFIGKTIPQGALILGSGGASQAAAYALHRMDIRHIVVSRSLRGDGYASYTDIDDSMLAEYPLLINATPLGTWPNTESAPPSPYERLTKDNMLYDMVYNPPLTRFMTLGRQAGARVTNGRRMLELQAEASWELFREADTE